MSKIRYGHKFCCCHPSNPMIFRMIEPAATAAKWLPVCYCVAVLSASICSLHSAPVSSHLSLCFAVCCYPHCQHREAVRQSSHSDSGQRHFWISHRCHHSGLLERGQLKCIHLHVCPKRWRRSQRVWDQLWKCCSGHQLYQSFDCGQPK